MAITWFIELTDHDHGEVRVASRLCFDGDDAATHRVSKMTGATRKRPDQRQVRVKTLPAAEKLLSPQLAGIATDRESAMGPVS